VAFCGLDVEIHHLEKAKKLKFANVKVAEPGPYFGALETEVKYGESTIKVTVSAI
jgi:alpha-mannosidase